MPSITNLTESVQLTRFEDRIRHQAYNKALGWRFMHNNAAVKTLPRGTLKDTYHRFEAMDPGSIGVGTQDLPENRLSTVKSTVKLCTIGTKLVYSQRELDAFMNAQHAGGDLSRDGISLIMKQLYAQVNQFIYNGDNMKDPLDSESDFSGMGEFEGLTDLGASFGAGADSDDDVTDAGDFFSTYNSARKTLVKGGYYPPYTII